MGWITWRRYPKALAAVLGSAVFCGGLLWALGIRDILPLIAAAFALACVVALLGVCVYRPGYRNSRVKLAVMGVHIGLAVLALGIALSGPYKQEKDAVLTTGEELQLGTYTFTYLALEREAGQRMEAYKAKLEVEKDGRNLGHMFPERRFYRNFRQPFAEAAVISGLGNELYATLLGFNQEGQVRVQVRINPGVNWIWIGGIIMCLAGLLAIRRKRAKRQAQSTEENIDFSLQPE
jgi:cytochrome c-type biogenesis protein CcmF